MKALDITIYSVFNSHFECRRESNKGTFEKIALQITLWDYILLVTWFPTGHSFGCKASLIRGPIQLFALFCRFSVF